MVWLIKRVALVIFPLCAALAVLIPQVWARDAAYSDSIWAALGFDDCALPCYAGIYPGITSYEAVPELLQQHVGGLVGLVIQESPGMQYWVERDERSISGTIYFQQGTVTRLMMVTDIEFAALFERLGAPNCVGVNANYPLLQMIWQQPRYTITAAVTATHPAESLRGIRQSSYISIQSNAADCQQTGQIKWQGYAPYWRYIQLNGM